MIYRYIMELILAKWKDKDNIDFFLKSTKYLKLSRLLL